MRSLFYLSMSSVTEFHFISSLGNSNIALFWIRFELFNIFPFPRCSFPTTSFWSILRVLRSLDSGLTHSTFFIHFDMDDHCVRGNFDTIRHFIISSVQLRQGQFRTTWRRTLRSWDFWRSISSTCNSDSVNLYHMELCFAFVSPTAADFVSRVFASHFWARWRILRFFIPAWPNNSVFDILSISIPVRTTWS